MRMTHLPRMKIRLLRILFNGTLILAVAAAVLITVWLVVCVPVIRSLLGSITYDVTNTVGDGTVSALLFSAEDLNEFIRMSNYCVIGLIAIMTLTNLGFFIAENNLRLRHRKHAKLQVLLNIVWLIASLICALIRAFGIKQPNNGAIPFGGFIPAVYMLIVFAVEILPCFGVVRDRVPDR